MPTFIYIDNVLGERELRQLLRKDMEKAKKVRMLLTAPDIDVGRALKVKSIVYAIKSLSIQTLCIFWGDIYMLDSTRKTN